MSLIEANKLVKKYITLRTKAGATKDRKIIHEFNKHEQLCVEKFKYLVLMKTGRYKNFNNYEDLNQEGLEALLKAMESYNPERGNFFWWAHKYIDTRIARCANLHTTIRFPLKYAKVVVPHRESVLPILIDNSADQYQTLESNEMIKVVHANFKHLSNEQSQMVQMLFGMNGETPHSIAKICKRFKIPRSYCVKMLDNIFDILKTHIRL